MLGELSPEEAADAYDVELRGVVFDLALLGIGPDGHTASLFPNDPALDELGRRAAAVPRPDVDRVTATIPQLNASETVLFLITGERRRTPSRVHSPRRPTPRPPPGSSDRTPGRRSCSSTAQPLLVCLTRQHLP